MEEAEMPRKAQQTMDAKDRKELLKQMDAQEPLLAGVADVFWNDVKTLSRWVDNAYNEGTIEPGDFYIIQTQLRVLDATQSMSNTLRKLVKQLKD
jgi:hypothetical protein